MTPVRAGVHTREHRSLTANLEKRLLIWIARRLPTTVTSDHLSACGLAAMALAGLGFAFISWWPPAPTLVVLALLVNWFGDSLDGTVARVRGQQRPRYGYYVDHVIDVAGTTLLMTGLSLSGVMTPLIATMLLAAYLMVCAESYLAAHSAGRFRMSFLGFGPTELRVVLAAGAVKAASAPVVSLGGLGPVLLFDLGGVIAIGGLGAAFIVAAARNTRALYREEPIPTVTAAAERAA